MTRRQRYERFVAEIQRYCQRPAARAALRSGLRQRPEQAARMHAYVAPFLHDASQQKPAEERAFYAVAALIAALPPDARGSQESDAPADDAADDAAEGAAEVAIVDVTPGKPGKVYGASLGTSLAVLQRRRRADSADSEPGGGGLTAAERRLHLLTRQRLDGLHRHLPGVVRRLQAERISVDWVQLLDDLSGWERNQDRIAKRWLQDYYRHDTQPQAAANALDTDPTTEE